MKINKLNYKKFSKKKLSTILIIALIIIYIIARYIADDSFRSIIDKNLFNKEISESNTNSIDLNSDLNPSIYAYDNYITMLSKNTLTEYNSSANKIAELSINISVPLYASDGKYLAIAEKEGKELYLISGTNILWQKTVDGTISQINVNQNGYVSLVIENTIYKSIVIYYDVEGNEVYKTYLHNSYVTCTAISTNNNYLAIGEVDYSNTIIKSYIKIVSSELAQTDPDNSIVYTYTSDKNEVITNINYKDKENAVCMFTSYIEEISPTSDKKLYDISSDDVFIDISSNNMITKISKQSSGLFSFEYELTFKNASSTSENIYILNNTLPESILLVNDHIALNFGNEIQIVNTSGYLSKKYTSSKQISNIVLGDSIIGIVYKNKIEIIKL